MQGPAKGANAMQQDARLRAPISLVPLHAFGTICYVSGHVYVLHECASSAFCNHMAHDTRVRAADILATREKMYTIVLVSTQKHTAGGELTSAKPIV